MTSKKPKAYIFDVDGTLAQKGDRYIFDYSKVYLDSPREQVINMAKILTKAGYAIIIFSGREASCLEETCDWLKTHGIVYQEIQLRPIKDNRDDTIVKKEMYDSIKDKFDIQGVFDDRPKVLRMWRDQGLTTFDVGKGIEF